VTKHRGASCQPVIATDAIACVSDSRHCVQDSRRPVDVKQLRLLTLRLLTPA
jgi:hypothetical protein